VCFHCAVKHYDIVLIISHHFVFYRINARLDNGRFGIQHGEMLSDDGGDGVQHPRAVHGVPPVRINVRARVQADLGNKGSRLILPQEAIGSAAKTFRGL